MRDVVVSVQNSNESRVNETHFTVVRRTMTHIDDLTVIEFIPPFCSLIVSRDHTYGTQDKGENT